jgi:hypothetical protein
MTFARSKFRAHVKAHKTVIADERWFRKGEPPLGRAFTVTKSVQRHATLIDILCRAGKRAARAGNDELADAYHRLRAKLTPCRPRRRCGSSACPKCARAFQRAKVAVGTIMAGLANARADVLVIHCRQASCRWRLYHRALHCTRCAALGPAAAYSAG